MGCDIHAFIEHDFGNTNDNKIKNYKRTFAKLYLSRDYYLFSILANVRRSIISIDNSAPIPPKGIPDNLSFHVIDEYTLCIVDDNDMKQEEEGYCSKSNAERWMSNSYSKKYDENRVTHPDWHSVSWMTIKEVKRVQDSYIHLYKKKNTDLEAVLGIMKVLKNPRFIFWFDN